MIKILKSSRLSTKRQQLWLAGLLSLLAYGYLCWKSQAYGQAGLDDLLISSIVAFLASVFVWNLMRNYELPILDVLVFAVAFRIVGLFTFPVLEDDFYRYLWDGFVAFEHGNPYDTAPSEWFIRDVPVVVEGLLDTINYPDIATVYGPSLQWLFAFSYWIAPAELWPLKCLLFVADMALIFILLRLAPARHIVLYAWSPLVIKEFVITMHPDLIGVTLLFGALLAYRTRSDISMGVLLALAAGVKVFALVIVPFLLLLRWKAWLGFALTVIAISLPFGLFSAWVPEGLTVMGQAWLFNAVLYELFGPFLSFSALKIALLILFIVFGGAYGLRWLLNYWQADSPRDLPRGDILFALLLIVLPVFNAWYMVWLLPFAVIRPSAWAWMASFALLLSYGSAINLPAGLGASLQDYQLPTWLLCLEFGLIMVALAWDLSRRAGPIKPAL